MNKTDEEIIDLIVKAQMNGDKKLFNKYIDYLCKNHDEDDPESNNRDFIKFLLYKIKVPNKQLAEDIVGDTWEKFIKRFQSGTANIERMKITGFKNYMKRSLYNTFKDIRKKEKGDESLDELLEEGGEMTSGHYEEDFTLNIEKNEKEQNERKMLEECLKKLPSQQRYVYELHHQKEHSIKDIAIILSMDYENIKSRLRYAVKKLTECLNIQKEMLVNEY